MNINLIELKKIEDKRGNLSVIEAEQDIPFAIKRVYYLYDIAGGSERGSHAHRSLHQFILAVSGSFDITLDDGFIKETITLNRSYIGVYVGPMTWRTIHNFSSGAVCLVLASAHYSESDYIRDYQNFKHEVGAI